jgi:AraC-like DNA-binding protein
VDPLSALLANVRADGALFDRSIVLAPWTIRFQHCTGVTIIVMLQGHGSLSLDDGSAAWLGSGDAAIVTGGTPFTISDGVDGSLEPTEIVRTADGCTVAGRAIDAEIGLGVHRCATADPDSTVVLTGGYEVPDGAKRRLLSTLPSLIVVRDEGSLCPVTDLTLAEISADQPGRQAVLDRLLDLLLLTALREWFERQGPAAPAWYQALTDPIAGTVLRLMHDAPERPWTVGSLAQEAGVSRATLARRFAEVVGEPPMAYLTSWRLSLAVDLLQRSDDKVETIARKVGYGSGFGLSVALKRVYGIRPTDVRAQRAVA